MKFSEEGSPEAPLVADIPFKTRVLVAHAVVDEIAQSTSAEILHIKGYAADHGLYEEGRRSSDVDVLVRPSHVTHFVGGLVKHGWTVKATFENGSIFQHAMTLWHDEWGYIDLHRNFPGIQIDASKTFDHLWKHRKEVAIAALPCQVPSRIHQALLILIHGARDPFRGKIDIAHIRLSLDEKEWAEILAEVEYLGAEVAMAAATGELAKFRFDQRHDVWAVMSEGGTQIDLFRARWRASDSILAKMALLWGSSKVNSEHLQIRLGREPNLNDYRIAVGRKFSLVCGEAWKHIKTLKFGGK